MKKYHKYIGKIIAGETSKPDSSYFSISRYLITLEFFGELPVWLRTMSQKVAVMLQTDLDELIQEVVAMDYNLQADEAYFIKQAEAYLKDKALRDAMMKAVDVINTDQDNNLIGDLVSSALTVTLSGGDDQDLMTMGDFMDIDMEEMKYYLFPIVSEGSYTLLFGEKGCGKIIDLNILKRECAVLLYGGGIAR